MVHLDLNSPSTARSRFLTGQLFAEFKINIAVATFL